jgi:CBS domain-containing protein
MPSQVSSRPGIDVSSPEKRLLLVVLAEAITALRHGAGARSGAGKRRFAETAAWFASLMRSGSFRRLPFVNDDGKLVGIVSLDDVLSLLAEEFDLIGRLLEREASHAGGRSARRGSEAKPLSRLLGELLHKDRRRPKFRIVEAGHRTEALVFRVGLDSRHDVRRCQPCELPVVRERPHLQRTCPGRVGVA